MDLEDEFDMHDANEDEDDNNYYFYIDDTDVAAAAGLDGDDAYVADYEFIDSHFDDFDDVVSHRHQLDKLSHIHCQTESELKFIREAWRQISKCRQVLELTYALLEHEHTERQLFEHQLGLAKDLLERLRQCAEKELQVYLNAESQSKDFNEFRKELAALTSVTRRFFANLV